jgi:hypothetical protein
MSTEDRPTRPADDPPIIVGGGGSTWIWIPNSNKVNYEDASTIPAGNLPDADTRPPRGQLGAYMAVYLPNFSVRKINPHDGEEDHGDKDVQAPRNHRTKFKSA